MINGRMRAVLGDITKMRVDAIVNAANESLLGGGGIDGAIHKAAGPGLLKECQTLGGCKVGDAKVTGAYNLPCKMIVHTVGPDMHDPVHGAADLLRSCYKRSMEVAAQHGAKTIAFPSISTGIFKYPLEEACAIALETVFHALPGSGIDQVVFVCFNKKTFEAYQREWNRLLMQSREDKFIWGEGDLQVLTEAEVEAIKAKEKARRAAERKDG